MSSRSLRLCRTTCLTAVLISLLACGNETDVTNPQTGDYGNALPEARAATDALDQATAEARKQSVSNIEYDIEITLSSDADPFSGTVAIRFDLADTNGESAPTSAPLQDLTLDFGGGQLQSVSLNGSPVEINYNGYFLTLPADTLRGGANTATIRYSHPYSKDGTGLHRFVDPTDGRTYLYSYLWPYYANRLFPAFDQPNLKARYRLSVNAPEDWVVVSMAPGVAAPAEAAGMTHWQFETTPAIATYAFSLHAGPYKVWAADADGIPLRLMARQSIAEFVAVEEWFEVTRRGLSYYAEYFDIPYPFGKYDQLLVPDFAIGAMENVAAVTFSEQRYVQRQTSDRSERERRASVILHEMAHMWFGDLVTHHWWNGMWLNESFATQMAAMASLATTEFDDTWHGFFTDAKQEAYQADSRVSTHPIEMPINSTIDFFQVFDAITYEKGASVLKQLAHYVGEENYRMGVSAYLKAHAYDNTELADFIAFQSQASGKDIAAWANQWLYQPGFNTLKVDSQCSDGRLQQLSIIQTAPAEYPTLRAHQVDLALYSQSDDGALGAPLVIPITVLGATTSVALSADLPCPALINANHNDWTLAQIELDPRSLETLQTQLAAVPDPLARSMFLAALRQRTLQGKASLASYLTLAMGLARSEAVIRIQQQISASVIETVDLMQRLRPETDQALGHWLPILEETALRLAGTAPSEDLQRIWFNTFVGVAGSETGLASLRALLDGELEVPGLAITADLRWQVLLRLAGSGVSDIDELLSAEAAADDSDFGVKSHLSALAARPDLAQKSRWLAELQKPENLTGLSRQRAVLSGLYPATQTALAQVMLADALASLPRLSHHVDPYFMTSYVKALLQPICVNDSVQAMQQALELSTNQLDSTALRFLSEAAQADRECLALRSAQ